MGLLSRLFGSKTNEIAATKVLVCAVGREFAPQLETDAATYSRHYPNCVTMVCDSASEVLSKLSGFDIVHLLCRVTEAGELDSAMGAAIPAVSLLETCVNENVKLLVVASGNNPEGYIAGFKAKGMPLNLVMTLDRRGEKYQPWLDALLTKLSSGKTLPAAWVAIVPQVHGHAPHDNAPGCIFFAGRGSVIFRP